MVKVLWLVFVLGLAAGQSGGSFGPRLTIHETAKHETGDDRSKRAALEIGGAALRQLTQTQIDDSLKELKNDLQRMKTREVYMKRRHDELYRQVQSLKDDRQVSRDRLAKLIRSEPELLSPLTAGLRDDLNSALDDIVTLNSTISDLKMATGGRLDIQADNMRTQIRATAERVEVLSNQTASFLEKLDFLEERIDGILNQGGASKCPEPTEVPNSKMTRDGTAVSYTCDSSYMECGNMDVTCSASGEWGQSGSCDQHVWINPELTKLEDGEIGFSPLLPCGEQDSLTLLATARPTAPTKTVFLLKRNDDILFLIAIRFNHLNTWKKVLFNSRFHCDWKTEIYIESFPFVVGETFDLEITLKQGVYKAFANGHLLVTYPEVKQGVKPDRVRVLGDVAVDRLEILY